MTKLDEITGSDKPDQDPTEKIEDSEESELSVASADLKELKEFNRELENEDEEFDEEGEFDEEAEFAHESDEDGEFDELLNDDLVDYLDEICLQIDNTVLEKILKSNSGYTESQMAVLKYNDDKIYYLADYDGGNTLRVNVGDFQKDDDYDIVSVQVPIATIVNTNKNIPDIMPDDVELMHFNMESDFSMEFYETYEDAEALYGESEDDESDEDDEDDLDMDGIDDISDSDNDDDESDSANNDDESNNAEDNESNNEEGDDNESKESSVDSVDPDNVL